MEVRFFQIVVPIIFVFYFIYEVKKVLDRKKGWVDLVPNIVLSAILVIIAVAPDWTTNKLANILGFKSNINAILFSLLGILCLFVLRIFDYIKDLQKDITKLSIEYALLNEKISSKE